MARGRPAQASLWRPGRDLRGPEPFRQHAGDWRLWRTVAADLMHILGLSLADLRRERWSAALAWHDEARRIAEAR
ncbi:hypothetical protein CHELA20_50917 [Hyphomicrobiales bacterium]|nr:hypothetical protein CHELA20_50917 [Hyphomicrobiales bacterium]CAH1675359.1 hypothetical protein CHELA41_24096 [Hyphomicrobiales bacterium]